MTIFYLLLAIVSALILFWIFRTYYVVFFGKEKPAIPKQPEAHEGIAPLSKEEQELRTQEPLEIDYSELNRAYRVADMHFARGEFEEAEKWFIKVLAQHEYHPEALNRLGVIYIQQNNPRRAEIIYRKLFSVTQKEPAYYCNYGRCLYNQGRLEDAIEAYENAVKLDSTRPTRFVSLGQIYYEIKNFEKALYHFIRALALDPHNLEYLNLTAELAEMVGDAEQLEQSLKKIVELDPYNEEAREKWKAVAGLTPNKTN